MRLIDKDEVMKKLSIADECEDCPFCSEEIFCGKQQDFVDACEAICDAPVVEIIHCKDCKYFGIDNIFGFTYCDRSGINKMGDYEYRISYNWTEDDFCSHAERRDDRDERSV